MVRHVYMFLPLQHLVERDEHDNIEHGPEGAEYRELFRHR
jgi:hypothetical protein